MCIRGKIPRRIISSKNRHPNKKGQARKKCRPGIIKNDLQFLLGKEEKNENSMLKIISLVVGWVGKMIIIPRCINGWFFIFFSNSYPLYIHVSPVCIYLYNVHFNIDFNEHQSLRVENIKMDFYQLHFWFMDSAYVSFS